MCGGTSGAGRFRYTVGNFIDFSRIQYCGRSVFCSGIKDWCAWGCDCHGTGAASCVCNLRDLHGKEVSVASSKQRELQESEFTDASEHDKLRTFHGIYEFAG